MHSEVKIEVVLIVILLVSAVELDCREQVDNNLVDTKGLSHLQSVKGKSSADTNQFSMTGRQAESMTTLSAMANGFVHLVVNFFNAVYNVVNSRTPFNALNSFTSAYSNLFNSDGWAAVDTSINTLGNTFNVYEALLLRFRNFAKLVSKQNDEDVDNGDNNNRELEQLQSSLDSLNDQLINVKELLKEVTCRYDSLTQTDGRRRSVSKECSIFRDQVRKQALLKE